MVDFLTALAGTLSSRNRTTLEALGNQVGAVFVPEQSADGLAYAIARGQSLELPVYGNGVIDMGTQSLTVNTQTTSLNGTMDLLWSGPASAGYGLNFIGVNTYLNRYKRTKKALSGVKLRGSSDLNNLFAMEGIRLGDGVGTGSGRLSLCQFDDFAVQGFSNPLNFTDGVWSVSFNNGQLLWGTIETPNVVTDFGERINFKNTFFADAGLVFNLRRGYWHIDCCSWDNLTLNAYNDSICTISQSHNENPGSSNKTPLFINVIGNEALVDYRQTPIVLSSTLPGEIDDGVFYVNPANTTGGLILDGFSVVQQGTYSNPNDPDCLNDYRSIVRSGSGRVQAHNMDVKAFSNFQHISVSERLNKLPDPSFEGASLAAWNPSGTAAQDTTIVHTVKRITQGTKSLRLTGDGTTPVSAVYAECLASPSQAAVFEFYRKVDATAGTGTIQTKIEAMDTAGNVLPSNATPSSVTATQDWAYGSRALICPPNTARVRVTMTVTRSSGTLIANYDDLNLNVI